MLTWISKRKGDSIKIKYSFYIFDVFIGLDVIPIYDTKTCIKLSLILSNYGTRSRLVLSIEKINGKYYFIRNLISNKK